jgi:hypothetical protein
MQHHNNVVSITPPVVPTFQEISVEDHATLRGEMTRVFEEVDYGHVIFCHGDHPIEGQITLISTAIGGGRGFKVNCDCGKRR